MICSCKVQDAWSNMFQAPLAGNPLQVTHNYPQLLLPIWSLCLLSLLRYIKSRGYSDSEKLATPQKWKNKKRSFDVTLLNSFESRDDVDFLTYNISTMTSTFCMWELFCKQKHWWRKSPWNSICPNIFLSTHLELATEQRAPHARVPLATSDLQSE